MKKIDETMLLLALGGVGDDLLARAEVPKKRRSMPLHWGALAACFCLIVALAVPNVLSGFRMGSDGNTADAYNGAASGDMETSPNSGAAADPKADEGDDAEVRMDEMQLRSGEEQLRLWGVLSGEELVSIRTGARGENASSGSIETEEKTEELSGLYRALCSATVTEEQTVLRGALPVSITLSSGMVLEGEYEEASRTLKLEGVVFLDADLSPWLGKESEP